jgi:Holliday junction DNA helicase RuvA
VIGRLRGILLQKQPPHLLVDVQGVAYEVDAPMSTFYDLPEVGKEIVLHTHLSIKEDAHSLYGFGTESDRALFRTLLKITGVGAKLALAVLSGASVAEFTRLIQTADVVSLTRIPGVGKKTAERMIVELKDKLGSFSGTGVIVGRLGAAVATDPLTEATIALAALGYKPIEVQALLKKVDATGLSAEELIRRALQAALRH